MPCLAGNCGPAGILTQVAIFKDRQHTTQFAAPASAGVPPPALPIYMALFDTGAGGTCVSPKVVTDLGLAPIAKVDMISASHVAPTNQYIFSVGFPIGVMQAPTGVIAGTMSMFENIAGLEFQPAGAVYDVLLGRDILIGAKQV